MAFIETPETKKKGIGAMNKARWDQMYQQLIEVKLVPKGLDVTQFYK